MAAKSRGQRESQRRFNRKMRSAAVPQSARAIREMLQRDRNELLMREAEASARLAQEDDVRE